MKYRNLAGALCSAFLVLWYQPTAAQTPISPSATPQVLSLGVVGPLTPSSKAFGIAHLQGITLAVAE
jgi:hypothetical protein